MMKKALWKTLLLAALCLALALPALAETRMGTIALEGQEEPIEETLFETGLGFSFWYVSEDFEAYIGEMDGLEGAVVESQYSDDYMVIFPIDDEDAEDYAGDPELLTGEERLLMDVYRELEDGKYLFLTLIAEDGQYLGAAGEYSMEAAEGNAKYFDRVLNSIGFTEASLIRAAWGETDEYEGEGPAQVILTAAAPVSDVCLLTLDWESGEIAWEVSETLGSLDEGETVEIELEFVGDFPEYGVMYTDEQDITYVFTLEISGMDGRLTMVELSREEGDG